MFKLPARGAEPDFFTDVVLPLPLPGYFTYTVPAELLKDISPGKRVVVQFGKKKIYTALVRRIHQVPPANYIPKSILSVLDESPVVNERQFAFWEWMAGYYLCRPGEVMNAALPSGLKLASESMIALNPGATIDPELLNEKELQVMQALSNREKLTIDEIGQVADLKKTIPLINNLIEKGLVVAEEKLSEKFKAKMESFIRLGKEYEGNDEGLKVLFDQLGKKAFRQLQLMVSFLHLSRGEGRQPAAVRKAELLKSVDATAAILNSLVGKGVLEEYELETSRLPVINATARPADIELSEHQKNAYNQIRYAFKEKEVVLLHGVTSSGKTELYIKLMDEAVRAGKQVLYLLPEIALTSQIINRLRKYFGARVGVYHSRYNENEKAEVWYKTLTSENGIDIVLGARSALFLPFRELGLVIVDEEHDTSYKQYDPAPRYNARDSAIFLAGLHHAPALLGSATPAVESYFNAQAGKYGLVNLTERYGGIKMPEVLVADLREETRQRTMQSHFSSILMKHTREALENKEQVILFQNRRGFSPHLECDSCHYIPMCRHCDISLTYHKQDRNLKCHYCGYSEPVPSSCRICGSTRMLMKGFGTEKVEEELGVILPGSRIKRMDYDSTRTKFAHHRIITDFEERRIDILVGTQMVTKGLDFDNVSVVGILNADNMIHFPDFRSFERSYQLMAQVSGRAGRKTRRGKVIIQTYQPQHPVVKFVIDNDYAGMFRTVLLDRQKFLYPPFYRLVLIRLKHRDAAELNRAAVALAAMLREILDKRVLGPEYPLVSRIQNYFIKQILVKIERSAGLSQVKAQLQEKLEAFQGIREFSGVKLVVDVDPM